MGLLSGVHLRRWLRKAGQSVREGEMEGGVHRDLNFFFVVPVPNTIIMNAVLHSRCVGEHMQVLRRGKHQSKGVAEWVRT